MSTWYYSYDVEASPERFRAQLPQVEEALPARLEGYRLAFSSVDGNGDVRATVVPQPGASTLGTAFGVEEDQLEALAEQHPGFRWASAEAQFADGPREVRFLVREGAVDDSVQPSEDYVGHLRESLSYLHPVSRVDAYLTDLLGREKIFTRPLIQRSRNAQYSDEYNCKFRRLYPWKGVTRPPWGGAIGIVAPGESTSPHCHDEEETAVVISGQGELTLEGESTPIEAGDVIFFPPMQTHTLLNTQDDKELEILFVWWGGADEERREAARLHN